MGSDRGGVTRFCDLTLGDEPEEEGKLEIKRGIANGVLFYSSFLEGGNGFHLDVNT